MDHAAIPARLLRLAEALVFASPRPATWRLLAPFLPAHLSTDDVFAALQAHCAERGVVLVQQADGWVFRTAPDLNAELQAALGEVRKLPRVALEVLVVIAYHQPITLSRSLIPRNGIWAFTIACRFPDLAESLLDRWKSIRDRWKTSRRPRMPKLKLGKPPMNALSDEAWAEAVRREAIIQSLVIGKRLNWIAGA
jgi:hypothetical protein